jgi:ribosomal protein S18 acetylase RimI-like enzyme
LTIRLITLGADDSAAYNAFLQRGVEQHPDTLRISAADIREQPFSSAPSADGVTFAALGDGDRWLGVVTLERERGRQKRRHIAWLLRMYVDANHAGGGVGRALLRAALAHARELAGVTKVNLTVAAHNARAVGLYGSEGFRSFAREEDAFRDSEPRAELTMSLTL